MYMHVFNILFVSELSLAHHSIPESELSGAEYSIALFCEVGDLVLAILLAGLEVRPILTAANFAPFNHLRQHHY